MTRLIVKRLFIDWTLDGSYTDESARLVSASGSVRLAAPESSISSPRGTVDRCTLVLRNDDGRYSPLNTSGALYAAIGGGGAYHAPMYLEVSIDNGGNYSRVFTGVIKIPREGPPTPRMAGTVEIDCRSRDEILLNRRLSTTLATFVALHDADATESDIIAQFLDDAGLSASDYTLDPGLFVVPWAWLDDESPIEDIWTLAAACGGRFYCDQEGEFRYENMTHWLFAPHDTSQETLTKSGYGQLDGPTYDDRELYSAVTVIASPRELLESGALWSADEAVTIPAGGSQLIVAKLRQPAYSVESITFSAVSSGGRDLDADITIAAVYYAQRVEMTISNGNATYAANLIELAINGVPVSGGPSLEERRVSSDAFWTGFATERPGRVKLLQGNPYVQTEVQAGMLAEFLRDRYELPRLTWKLRNIPGVATRRLGDRITTGNTDAMSANRDGFLTAIDWRLGNFGFNQDLEFLDSTGLYQYDGIGDDGYFVLGENVLGDTTGDIAHLFY